MDFLWSVCYLAATGILSFLTGRLLARHSLPFEAFPFRSFPFENDGQIYKKLKISVWQSRVPDMSRLFKKWMPPKKLESRPNADILRQMINETCVAELIHLLLCVSGLGLLRIWRGAGGVLLYLVYFLLGNLPFILIQRYNRPRLVKLLRRKGA